MENKQEWKIYLSKAGQAVAGFLSVCLTIMGYYPLVPAFYAAARLWRRRSFFLYAGIVAGMAWNMDYRSVLRYILLLLVIGIAIPFYQWANRRCGGIAAGIIAGVCTIAMNFSETVLVWENRQTLLLGASEGVLVMGFTAGLHYLMELLRSLQLVTFGMRERRLRRDASEETGDGRMDALVHAVGGLADAVSAHEDGGGTGGNMSMSYEEPFPDLQADGTGEAVCRWERGADVSRAWQLRMRENRMAIAQQLSAMVELMQSWNSSEHLLDDKSRLMMARILLETKERGFLIEDLHVLENEEGRRYVRARVAARWESGIPSRNLAKALERAMHCSIRLEREVPTVILRDWVRITAYEDTAYYTLPGIAMQKKDDSVITGDNFTMFDLDSGMHYVGLSDGMGSGFAASRESELVVDLLERLLRAGFDERTAISLMNATMVLQGENQSFSTLDLAALDLYSGELELYKVGAAASFVRHGEQVTAIAAASLPAGADPQAQTEPDRRMLEHGDFLVMVSDGVLDCFPTEDAQSFVAELIGLIRTDNAGVLARTLLERAMQVAGGQVRDDMTVLVTGIWEKSDAGK